MSQTIMLTPANPAFKKLELEISRISSYQRPDPLRYTAVRYTLRTLMVTDYVIESPAEIREMIERANRTPDVGP